MMNANLNTKDNKRGDILIIDDTPDNLRFLSDLLNKAGYSVRKVIRGELGLEAAQLQLPDLILLDVKMPGLSGYNVCDQLKRSERTQEIPVIFLSAMDEELDKVMAFEAGAVDYITKPFQIVEVLARIENHLQVSRLRQTLQQQNAQLQKTVEKLIAAETALETLHQALEVRILERTTELQTENERLLALQLQLQQALTQERTINANQAQRLSNIAQKLQDEVAAITTAVEQLQSSKKRSDEENKSLKMIAQSTQTINALRETLLSPELANPEAKAPLDLTQFCRTFVERWRSPNAVRYQLTFVTWGKSPGLIQLDQSLLQQLLSHLITNAVTYSPEGGTILFQLVYEATQANIQIRDEGSGIPATEIEQIVKPGYRASHALPNAASELRLTVAKQIAEQLGGKMTISSEVNRGTTVTFTLPLN